MALSRKPLLKPEKFGKLALSEQLKEIQLVFPENYKAEIRDGHVFVPLEGNEKRLETMRQYHGMENHGQAISRAVSYYLADTNRELVQVKPHGSTGFCITPKKN